MTKQFLKSHFNYQQNVSTQTNTAIMQFHSKNLLKNHFKLQMELLQK